MHLWKQAGPAETIPCTIITDQGRGKNQLCPPRAMGLSCGRSGCQKAPKGATKNSTSRWRKSKDPQPLLGPGRLQTRERALSICPEPCCPPCARPGGGGSKQVARENIFCFKNRTRELNSQPRGKATTLRNNVESGLHTSATQELTWKPECRHTPKQVAPIPHPAKLPLGVAQADRISHRKAALILLC